MPDTEERTLHTAGTIPGFPGGIYGAGRYLLNWIERTVTRIEDDLAPDPAPTEQTTAPTRGKKTKES